MRRSPSGNQRYNQYRTPTCHRQGGTLCWGNKFFIVPFHQDFAECCQHIERVLSPRQTPKWQQLQEQRQQCREHLLCALRNVKVYVGVSGTSYTHLIRYTWLCFKGRTRPPITHIVLSHSHPRYSLGVLLHLDALDQIAILGFDEVGY